MYYIHALEYYSALKIKKKSMMCDIVDGSCDWHRAKWDFPLRERTITGGCLQEEAHMVNCTEANRISSYLGWKEEK